MSSRNQSIETKTPLGGGGFGDTEQATTYDKNTTN